MPNPRQLLVIPIVVVIITLSTSYGGTSWAVKVRIAKKEFSVVGEGSLTTIPTTTLSEEGIACNDTSGLLPGRFEGKVWHADNCDWRPEHSFINIRKCFAEKHLGMVGDWNLREIAKRFRSRMKFGRLPENTRVNGFLATGKDIPLQFHTGSTRVKVTFFRKTSINYEQVRPPYPYELSKFDHFIYSPGIDDVGQYSACGPHVFYQRLLKQVVEYKNSLQSHATFSIFILSWLFLTDCDEICQSCFSPSKVQVYREAMQLAASCSNVSIIDTSALLRYMGPSHSLGFNKLRPTALDTQLDIILRGLCYDDTFASPNPISCSDQQAIRLRWDSVPDAFKVCASVELNCDVEEGVFW